MRNYSNEMVTLDVKFTCETCFKWVVRQVRVGTNFMLGGDNLPDGWVIRPETGSIRCWCPLHTMDAK